MYETHENGYSSKLVPHFRACFQIFLTHFCGSEFARSASRTPTLNGIVTRAPPLNPTHRDVIGRHVTHDRSDGVRRYATN